VTLYLIIASKKSLGSVAQSDSGQDTKWMNVVLQWLIASAAKQPLAKDEGPRQTKLLLQDGVSVVTDQQDFICFDNKGPPLLFLRSFTFSL
jgi:hypothetical protein